MKTFWPLLLFFITILNGISQSTDTIRTVQLFTKNKIYKYDVERGRYDSKIPELKKWKSVTPINMKCTILKNGDRKLEFIYGRTYIPGMDLSKIDKVTYNQINLYEKANIQILVSESGVYKKVIDHAKLKSYLLNCYEKIQRESNPDITSKEIGKMKKIYEPTTKDPDILIQTYFPEIFLIMSISDQKYIPGESYKTLTALPNPFGGDAFIAYTNSKIKSVKDQIVQIEYTTEPDKSDFNEKLKQTFELMAKRGKKKIDISDYPDLTVKNTCIFSYNTNNQIVQEVYSEKHMKLPGRERTDRLHVIEKK